MSVVKLNPSLIGSLKIPISILPLFKYCCSFSLFASVIESLIFGYFLLNSSIKGSSNFRIIVEEEPIEKTIKTNLSVGNKKIGNIQIIESHSSFYEVIGARKLTTVLEILTMMNEIDSTKVLEVSNLIEEYLSDYRDSSFEVHINDEYSRSVYLRLASILDSMNKPHNVMGIYVSKTQV